MNNEAFMKKEMDDTAQNNLVLNSASYWLYSLDQSLAKITNNTISLHEFQSLNPVYSC